MAGLAVPVVFRLDYLAVPMGEAVKFIHVAGWSNDLGCRRGSRRHLRSGQGESKAAHGVFDRSTGI